MENSQQVVQESQRQSQVQPEEPTSTSRNKMKKPVIPYTDYG